MDAYRRGDLEAARAAFESARAAYQADGNSPRAAEMANNLSVVLVRLGRGAEAVRVVEGTPAVFSAAGDRSLAAKATGNLAAALESVGRLDDASAAYLRALEEFHALGDGASESETWQALSRLQLRQGDALAAAASAQAALDSGPKPGPVRRLIRRLTGKVVSLPRA
jgi:tetratricopeptide (TPR) repeat protein